MAAPSSEINVKTEPVSDPHTLSFPEKVELFEPSGKVKAEPVNAEPM